MGVHRITSLLHNEGWIPSEQKDDGCACSGRLWKDWNPSMAFLNQGLPLEQIAPNSTFLIDGNGLAFFFFKVAYARHLHSTFRTDGQQSCPPVNAIETADISKALPCMLPLSLLEDITHEFVSHLRLCDLRLQVFWDGPSRRFKTVTLKKRKEQREAEWSNLQQFCVHGSLPNEKHICHFLHHFPFPSMFLQCIRKALQREQVDVVYCQEEADVELARRASGDSGAYVLGQDSDFFFYKDIQYVPLDCIFTSNSSIHASVGRRADLAKLLGLEDEQMIELAILLGNDYVQNIKLPKEKKGIRTMDEQKNPYSVASYLQRQEDGFMVQAQGREAEMAFVRALYDLRDLESFPMQDSSNLTDIPSADEDDEITAHLKVSLPDGLRAQVAMVSQEDTTISDAIQRCLAVYIEQTEDDNDAPLQHEHLAAYMESMASPHNGSTVSLGTRPRWIDVRAAYVIEMCISRILRSSKDSLLVRLTQPGRLFSHYQFHSILAALRPSLPDSIHEGDDDETLTETGPQNATVERKTLPIDAHQDIIVNNIQNNRVTIIHGETGCGKSSRVPIMLLEAPSPEPSLPEVKFFISQPRRIAAKGLVERIRSCEPKYRDKFALRMGHGWKEYETKQTQAWFVTTGYLTRLLANHPERFDDCTHLIIDEVHERSVDTDILCLLCRRLLETNKKIRLVLMSATLATKLYKEYFNVPDEPIHVGVRTFPITQYFVEDLMRFKLAPKEAKAALAIQKECEQKRCNSAPSGAELTKRFSLAAHLAKTVGKPGSSVLIFVPGMNEIVAITECIDNFHVTGIRYSCCPIHSEIPFEDQMDAFNAPENDEVKIIIATNAAESSVTLPNVDHVICLGLCRQIMYNPVSHRQMLSPCWISRASATQRAGRTGRVRPGNVYRLYTRHAFESFMEEFDPGEIRRVPLDSIILMLKQMLHEEVIPVLQQCIEPPQMETIDRSFQSLHRSSFLVEANDQADITALGSFVSSLGIDLTLGSLVGLGIQFGVAAEAIEMAAIMSFPKTPFQMTSPMFHDPATFNEITAEGYVARCHFDANLYSEPLSLMNALWDYHMAPNKMKWCLYYRIAIARMKQLVATRNSLRKRVADYFGINEDRLMLENPPAHMPHAKTVILRLLQVWVFSDIIIECPPSKNQLEANGSISLSLQKGKKQQVEKRHLDQVLLPERHPYEIQHIADMDQSGHFEHHGAFALNQFISEFEKKLVSYMIETDIDMACCYNRGNFYLFTNDEKTFGENVATLFHSVGGIVSDSLVVASCDPNVKRRGLLERKCGTWSVRVGDVESRQILEQGTSKDAKQKQFRKIHAQQSYESDFVPLCYLMNDALIGGEVTSVLFWEFLPAKGKKKKKSRAVETINQSFSVISRGACQAISKFDLQDLLGTQEIHAIARGDNTTKIRFLPKQRSPFPYDGPGKELLATSHATKDSSWSRPLFQDIPEGARLLSVLVSGQRRGGQRLRFTKGNEKGDPEDTLDITLDKGQSDMTRRWERLGKGGSVFVPENTVPASATNTVGPLFACCSNSLEIKGGMMKVEGMTLLPPNPLFLLLAFLSFGLEPNVSFTWNQMGHATGDNGQSEKKRLQAAISWLNDQTQMSGKGTNSSETKWNEIDAKERIQTAMSFHDSCSDVGETLLCFPEMIISLCNLFSFVDGYEVAPWESLADKAFTPNNLARWRNERRTTVKEKPYTPSFVKRERTPKANNVKEQKKKPNSSQSPRTPNETRTSKPSIANTPQPRQNDKTETNGGNGEGKRKDEKLQIERHFPDGIIQASSRWFATSQNEELGDTEFPSTNILALLFQMYNDEVLGEMSTNEKNSISLDAEDWEISSYTNSKGRVLYQARFINDLIPTLPILGRGKNKLPKWMKKHMRPTSVAQERSCIPPGVPHPKTSVVQLSKDGSVLMYDSIELAIRMESAFWLERQFCLVQKSGTRHWYNHNMQQMTRLLKQHAAAN